MTEEEERDIVEQYSRYRLEELEEMEVIEQGWTDDRDDRGRWTNLYIYDPRTGEQVGGSYNG